jgi:hypothetical protein
MDNKAKNADKKKKARATALVPTRTVHPLTGEARLLMDNHDRLRFVKSLIKQWCFPSQKTQFSVEQLKTVRQMSRELFGKTQEPTILMASDFNLIVATAGGLVQPAAAFYWGGVIDQGSWALVFDEVKVLKGQFEVYPLGSTALTAPIVFCIDYDDNAALASSAAALAYDTREVFNLVPTTLVGPSVFLPQSRAILPVRPQGIPDKQWIDTADTTTVVAYLKGYGTSSASASVFRQYFLMGVKFRQVN